MKKEKEEKILNLLPKGKEKAISSERLARLSGVGSVRELQKIIAKMRKEGAIICSSSAKGYWLPKNRKEIEEFCRTMDKRARNIFNATRSAKKALELPEGQQNVE